MPPSSGLPRRHPHQEVALAALAPEPHLGLRDAGLARVEPVQQLGELRHRLDQRLPGRRLRVEVEQRRRGGVHHLDPPCAVEPDDAGGHAREHRIEQPPPPLGLGVGGDQRVALALHLPGHLVEGAPEERDLVVALLLAHPDVEVALPDPLGGAGEPADRPRQPLGEPEPHPDRGEDHHEREAEVDQRELEEQPPAVGLELLVEPHRLLRLVEQAQDLPVDVAADVEEVVGEGRELQQRPELVVLPVLDDDDLAGARPGDVLGATAACTRRDSSARRARGAGRRRR